MPAGGRLSAMSHTSSGPEAVGEDVGAEVMIS